jgi:hypothetical protein
MRVGHLLYGHGRVLAVGPLVSVAWEQPIGPPQVPAAGLHPDPSDPATRGVLLALLREASGDASLSVLRNGGRAGGCGGARSWRVVTCDASEHPGAEAPTEGEALASALCALARALPSPEPSRGTPESAAEPHARPTPLETP